MWVHLAISWESAGRCSLAEHQIESIVSISSARMRKRLMRQINIPPVNQHLVGAPKIWIFIDVEDLDKFEEHMSGESPLLLLTGCQLRPGFWLSGFEGVWCAAVGKSLFQAAGIDGVR